MKQDTSYQVDNFKALNKAVEQESIKQERLNSLTKTIKVTYMIAAVAGVLLILLFLIGIYKLWVYDFYPQIIEKPVIVEKPTTVTPSIDYEKLAEILFNLSNDSGLDINPTSKTSKQSTQHQDALSKEADLTRKVDVISKQETFPEEELTFIETTFTIFHSTIIPTGESVVTGKEYDPQNITSPSHQYCYLRSEIGDSSFKSSVTELANFKDGSIRYFTTDNYLNELVDSYCVFN